MLICENELFFSSVNAHAYNPSRLQDARYSTPLCYKLLSGKSSHYFHSRNVSRMLPKHYFVSFLFQAKMGIENLESFRKQIGPEPVRKRVYSTSGIFFNINHVAFFSIYLQSCLII